MRRIAVGDRVAVNVTIEVSRVERLDPGLVKVSGDCFLNFVDMDGGKEMRVYHVSDLPVITDEQLWEER